MASCCALPFRGLAFCQPSGEHCCRGRGSTCLTITGKVYVIFPAVGTDKQDIAKELNYEVVVFNLFYEGHRTLGRRVQ